MKDTLFYLIKILSKTTRPVVAKIVQEQGCDVKPPRPLGYIVGCLYIRPNRDPRQKVSIVYRDYDPIFCQVRMEDWIRPNVWYSHYD